ncbi:MAG: hypothetical protein EOM50_10945 [Erysipelotrichia bacterium]|nr:hypothetical protein [Erysipelotrichia bacterium]
MIKYYIIVAVTIIVLCLIVVAVKRLILKTNSETDVSTNMITSGIALMASAFHGTKEAIMTFVLKFVDKELNFATEYAAIVCGMILIVLGIIYRIHIKYVRNSGAERN